MWDQIEEILERMTPITLEQMKDIRLMDRVDSKFVASVGDLPELLEAMVPLFMVQTINHVRIAPYATQYFDTREMNFFLMHQNGKLNRQKIRIRSYVDSELSFLEVKNKNNKGRTRKVRIQVEQPNVDSINDLDEGKVFLNKHSFFDVNSLVPVLDNSFKRITLVNNRKTERITMDISLLFSNTRTSQTKMLDDLVVLELKQDGWQHSDFREILNRMRIKQVSFSKYCMGMVLTDPAVKYNRFKRKLVTLKKINPIKNDSI